MGIGAVRRSIRCEVVGRRGRCAVVPKHQARVGRLRLGESSQAPLRSHRHIDPWRRTEERRVEGRLVVLCTDGPGQHFRGDIGHLMVAVVLDDEHVLGRNTRIGMRGQVFGVAVILTPVPQELGQLQYDLLVDRVGVGGIEDRGEFVPVHGSIEEKSAVVHSGHAENDTGPLRGQCRHRTAHDPALAVPHVAAGPHVEEHLAVDVLERWVGGKTVPGVDQPAEKLEIHESLQHVVGLGVKARHVLQVALDIPDVARGHSHPVRGATHHVAGDGRGERSTFDFTGAPQEAVTVDRRTCRSTVQAGGPASPTVYGHGLLGSASEVEGGSFSAAIARNMMGCATDWVGMSSSDVGNVERNLQDMSGFHTQTDHMLQGFVNFQFLGRLINSRDGFATNPAFQDVDGKVLFHVGASSYMGYSQGGIMGGAVSALSTEWTSVILGVPGMDYGGLLLNRSVDWNEFSAVFDPSYPNPVDQQIVLQLAQLLWDRGENDGYAEHLTSHPYPGIPAKHVFIIENYGDHQVANASAEMLARTIGAQNHQPAFNPSFFGAASRINVPVAPQWGLTALNQTKPTNAGLVLWDYGTPTPPTDNLAPNGAAYGADPHGFGRGNVSLLNQITTFLQTGVIPDQCGGLACQSMTP